MATARLATRLLCLAMLCLGLAAQAHATDRIAVEISNDFGKIAGWRMGPEIVLRHCLIHSPAGLDKMRAAFKAWQAQHQQQLQEVDELIDASAHFIETRGGLSAEQSRLWLRDNTTLTIESMYFWNRDRLDTISVCLRYGEMIEHYGSQALVEDMQNTIRSLKARERIWRQ